MPLNPRLNEDQVVGVLFEKAKSPKLRKKLNGYLKRCLCALLNCDETEESMSGKVKLDVAVN